MSAEKYKLEPPHFFFAVKELADRCLKYDLNAIVIIVGEQGSGKSSLALRMGEMLREHGLKFNIDSVYFDIKDFIENAGEERTVSILEEAGVQAYSRNFMTEVNKTLSYISQTVRFKNSVTIMTLPHLKLIDKNQRMLATHVWRTEAVILPDGSLVRVASAFRPHTNYISDTIKLVPVTIKARGGVSATRIPVANVRWKMPERELWEQYLQKKAEYWEKWRKKWTRKVSGPRTPIKVKVKEYLEKNPDVKKVLLDPTRPRSYERAKIIHQLAKEFGAHPEHIRKVVKSLSV